MCTVNSVYFLFTVIKLCTSPTTSYFQMIGVPLDTCQNNKIKEAWSFNFTIKNIDAVLSINNQQFSD